MPYSKYMCTCVKVRRWRSLSTMTAVFQWHMKAWGVLWRLRPVGRGREGREGCWKPVFCMRAAGLQVALARHTYACLLCHGQPACFWFMPYRCCGAPLCDGMGWPSCMGQQRYQAERGCGAVQCTQVSPQPCEHAQSLPWMVLTGSCCVCRTLVYSCMGRCRGKHSSPCFLVPGCVSLLRQGESMLTLKSRYKACSRHIRM